MKPTDKTSKNSLGQPEDYPGLLTEIKERIRTAQYEALKVVNKELVGLYWDYWSDDCGARGGRLGQICGGAVIR